MSGEAPDSAGSQPSADLPAQIPDRLVFISYASQDVAIADSIVEALGRQGLKCWIAPRDVTPGASYAGQIIHAIDAAKASVLILSQNAASSPHVLREVERAASKRHAIISLRIDQAPLPADFEYFLSTSHWLDTSADDVERALPKLVAAVQIALNAPADMPAGAPTSHAPTRVVAKGSPSRTVLVVASVVSLGLMGLAANRLWLSSHRAAAISATTASAPTIPEKSIAVLPFVDMSEKKDQEYFSDGLSEELIDMLTKVPELRVPARTSSFYFKGKQATVPEIAKALGVADVLEGSVRKSGNHLRITAQLVRADNGYHLWSETYDRQLDDIFKVQDEIAGAVVKALKISMLETEAPSAILTTSTEAYELYLQAGSLLDRGTSDDTLTAYAHLQHALRLDPNFALAWARLAALLSTDAVDWTRVFKPSESMSQSSDVDQSLGPSWTHSDIDQNWSRSWAQARSAAHAAAERALLLGPALRQSHTAMATVLENLDWDWEAADAELKKARALEPGNASVTLTAAGLAMTLGRVAEGLQLAKGVEAQDPLGAIWTIAYGQYVSGALEEAQKSYRKLIELYPTATHVHSDYAFVLLARGEPQAALSEFERESAPQFRDVGRPFALDALGRRSEADRDIALAEQNWANGMAWNIGQFYASRNDPDRAFSWWERAYRQHDGGMSYLKMDPICSKLHRDPRYEALLRKMNLPE
jgi:TolB-like protein